MACDDDLLDKLPEGEVTGPGELGKGGFETDLFGIYSSLLSSSTGQWERYWFGSIRSDDAAKGSTPGDAAAFGTAFNDFDYNATNFINQSWWNGHYNIIFDCNELINNIEDLDEASEQDLVNEAEAKTIRAWMMFELRRDYGEIPIVTATIDTPEDAIKAKSSVDQVDAFIEQDLLEALDYLPIDWASYPGRIDQGAAKSLLGKLYLYQKEWAKAYTAFSEVIASGQYDLDPDLVNLFEEGGDTGVESILEIQQLVTPATNYSGNYYISQGVRGTGSWNLGWGFNVPTQDLVDAFESGDARKDNTILYSGQDDGGFGSGVLPGVPPLAQPYWNKKAYTKSNLRAQYGMNANRWENIKIIRYADVLLMAAEAANESGQTAAAIDLINKVRNRASLANTAATSQTQVRDAIKQERRVELALEEHRFYDLVRWNDATAVLGSLGYEPRNALYPIPQQAIDQSGGTLTQNPDY